MASFDAAAFARGLVGPAKEIAKPLLVATTDDARELVRAFQRFEATVQSTLDALSEADDEMARLLHEDLETYLPARRDAIVARAANKLATDAQALLETLMDFAVKAAIVAGRAFLGV